MALTDRQRASLLKFVDVAFSPASVERARRLDATHTADGRLIAEMLVGAVPAPVLPMIELGQLPAPEGTDYDTLEDYINALPGGFLPTADPTFTGTLTGPTLAITGQSSLGNGDADPTQVYGHLSHRGSQPSIAVGAALGTGGSVSASVSWGTDQVGSLALIAGTAALTTGILATITFATARPDTNYAISLTPRNATAGVNATEVYVNADSTTQWTIRCNVAPGSGNGYGYFYQIIEGAAP